MAQVPVNGITAELILARVNFTDFRTNQELKLGEDLAHQGL